MAPAVREGGLVHARVAPATFAQVALDLALPLDSVGEPLRLSRLGAQLRIPDLALALVFFDRCQARGVTPERIRGRAQVIFALRTLAIRHRCPPSRSSGLLDTHTTP